MKNPFQNETTVFERAKIINMDAPTLQKFLNEKSIIKKKKILEEYEKTHQLKLEEKLSDKPKVIEMEQPNNKNITFNPIKINDKKITKIIKKEIKENVETKKIQKLEQQPIQNYPVPPNLDNQDKFIENCEIAKAKGIKELSNTTRETLEMLSSIGDDDVQRLGLLLSIADDKELNLDNDYFDKDGTKGNFLHDYVYHELKLNNSKIIKRGGIRSEQFIQILKTEILADTNNNSVFGKIKNRLS